MTNLDDKSLPIVNILDQYNLQIQREKKRIRLCVQYYVYVKLGITQNNLKEHTAQQ